MQGSFAMRNPRMTVEDQGALAHYIHVYSWWGDMVCILVHTTQACDKFGYWENVGIRLCNTTPWQHVHITCVPCSTAFATDRECETDVTIPSSSVGHHCHCESATQHALLCFRIHFDSASTCTLVCAVYMCVCVSIEAISWIFRYLGHYFSPLVLFPQTVQRPNLTVALVHSFSTVKCVKCTHFGHALKESCPCHRNLVDSCGHSLFNCTTVKAVMSKLVPLAQIWPRHMHVRACHPCGSIRGAGAVAACTVPDLAAALFQLS